MAMASKAKSEGLPLFSKAPAESESGQDRMSKIADTLIYNFQNQFAYLGTIQKQVGPVPESQDASLTEELYSGTVRAKTEDFHDDMRDPLVKAMFNEKLQYEEVQSYLHARHAPSANAAMREINPTQTELDEKKEILTATRDSLKTNEAVVKYIAKRREIRQADAYVEEGEADDSLTGVIKDQLAVLRKNQNVKDYINAVDSLRALTGIKPFSGDNTALSGMSNEESRAILAKAKQDGKDGALGRVAVMVDAIIAKTRKIIVDGGLEKQETIDAWEAKYDHYVPLHRDEVGTGNPVVGQGYNIRGPESKRRTGSQKEVTNILAHVVAQHEAAIIRSEKVKVDRALYAFLQAHPDSEVATLDKPDMTRVIDPTTGLVVDRVDPLYTSRPNVLSLKIDGEEHTIAFNENNLAAMRLAASMKNMSSAELGEVTKMVGKFTRFLATMNTSANPVFVARNFLRDLSTAYINLSDTELAGMKAQVFKDVPKAIRGFWNMARGDISSEWAKYAREFRDAGAQVGWLEHYKNIEQRTDKLKSMLEGMGPGKLNFTKREASAWWSLIEDANMAVENGIRLSSYINARRSGMSAGKSASLAKNLTVNFNKKGSKSVDLNMWYMFMNASIQGTTRMIKALKNPQVQKIIGWVVASGFLLDILARSLAGDDDDDGENDYDQLPEHVKAMNFVFWVGGKPVTIPMPYGYNFFASVGRKMSETMFRPNYSPVRSAIDLADVFVNAFSPTGQSGSALQYVMPTIIDPFVQWSENRNFAGNPLRREQMPFAVPKPEYQLGFRSTSAPAQWLAEFLNDVTGGNEVRPGFVNVNPSAFDFAITSVTGGAGRTYLQAINLPIKIAQDEEIQSREVPFWNIFMSARPEAATERKYFENIRKTELAMEELKTYRGEPERSRQIREDHGGDLRMVGRAKATSTMLANIRKRERLLDKIDPQNEREQRKVLEERKRMLMNRFNRAYSDSQARQ